jgi:hypothetical protein
MALLVYYESTKDGEDTDITWRLRKDSMEITMGAEEGNAPESTIELDDPDGDLDVVGWRRIFIFETTGEIGYQLIGAFWIKSVKVKREGARGTYKTDVGRFWQVSMVDSNALLHFRILKGTAKRPSESSIARIAWILDNDHLNRITDDVTYVNPTSVPMEGDVDYNGQRTNEIIGDVAQQSGDNYFILTVDAGPHPEDCLTAIWVGPYGAPDIYDSDLFISNYLADTHGSPDVFEMSEDTELERKWERTHSGGYLAYDGGAAYAERADSIIYWTRRDASIPGYNIKTQSKALARINRVLRDVAGPEDVITTTIIVPPADVNRAREGMRVRLRASHLPGYQGTGDTWYWFRILQRTVRFRYEDYQITFDLAKPTQGTPSLLCTNLTETGSFYPLGGSGVTPNLSGGNVFYLRPGMVMPEVYTEDHQGSWHFPEYGAGGAATVDYAGDCTLSSVRCLVVGDGTMEIHTAIYSASARNLTARLMHADPGAPSGYVVDETQTGVTGEDFTFTVSTHGGVNCTHWVDIYDSSDTCGGKWGFSGFDWTADA